MNYLLCDIPMKSKTHASTRCFRRFSHVLCLTHVLCSSLLIFLFCQTSLGFNLDAKFSEFFKGPNKKTYFGYDVEFFSGKTDKWIIVGAPNSQSGGAVYKCRYGSNSTCKIINFQRERISTNVDPRLGSTVVMGLGKQLLVCAPVFAQLTTSSVDTYYDLTGMCYLLKDFTKPKKNVYRYQPCIGDLGSHYANSHSYCQAGFSAAFTADKSKVLLGAVGSYYNQGSIMLIDALYQNLTSLPFHTAEFRPPPGVNNVIYLQQTYDANYMGYSVATGTTVSKLPLLVTSAPKRFGNDLLGMVLVYDETMEAPLVNFTGVQAGEYFGYGLAMVDLNNDGLDDVVVGSPLYTDLERKRPEIGRIYIYYQQTGASSTSQKRHLVFSEPTIVNGNSSMSRFGHTITSLDDINNDGYKDVLVSAPYEGDESDDTTGKQYGAVYVFNGGRDGVRPYPSQAIRGVDLQATAGWTPGDQIRGFGYSMRGAKDLDDNGYNDVVVGAYLSDHAVVIRARPVVNLLAASSIRPNKIDLETLSCDVTASTKAACYEVETCFSYTGKNLPPTVDITYTYDVDSGKNAEEKRSYLLDATPQNMTLKAGMRACVKQTVYMKKDVHDKLSDIAVTVSYQLHAKNRPIEPILDMLTGDSNTTQAEIFKDCGPDEICTPDLKLTASINPTTAYVGTYTEVVMSATVENKGENAYLTTLVVEYPLNSSFVGVHDTGSPVLPNCVDTPPMLMCELANPLKNNKKASIQVKFGVNGLLGNTAELVFKSYANSTNEQNNESNRVTSTVTVDVLADIQIFNATTPDLIALKPFDEDIVVNGSAFKAVSHLYEITNNGPSTISSASVSLLWPLRTPDGHFLLGLDQVFITGPLTCSSVHIINASAEAAKNIMVPTDGAAVGDGTGSMNYYNCRNMPEQCYEMTCIVGEMKPKSVVSMTLKGTLMISPLRKNALDSMVTSSLQFSIVSYPYQISAGKTSPVALSEVSTLAAYPPAPTSAPLAWWIIAVAVAAGILFLLIIILILWKCGFFKRKQIRPNPNDQQQQQRLVAEKNDEADEMQKEMEQHIK